MKEDTTVLSLSEYPVQTAVQQLYTTVDVLHKRANQTWKIVNTFVYTRVPIICLTHIQSKIKVDINFSKGAAPARDLLVSYMFDLQPIGKNIFLIEISVITV